MSKKRGQNEGSIYQLADGRWCAIVPATKSYSGKRKIIYGSFRNGTNTREAVADKLHKYLAGEPGPTVRPDQHTVASYLAKWLEQIEQNGELRAKTLESYKYTVNSLIVPTIGAVKLQALDSEHVRYMMRQLGNQKPPKAPRTVRYARSVLGIALGEAARKKPPLISSNPASSASMGIKKNHDKRRRIQPVDAGSIAAALEKVKDPSDRLLLLTIATFGLRIGEALGLQWRSVDWEAKSISITQAAQRQPKTETEKSHVELVEVKTENALRTLQGTDSFFKELRSHRVAQKKRRLEIGSLWQNHDLVFPSVIGTPQDARNVLRVLHTAQAAAGVGRSSLHRLRHSLATYLLSHGESMDVISSILGHSSTRVTREFYASFELAQQKQAATVMENAFAPRKKAEVKRGPKK